MKLTSYEYTQEIESNCGKLKLKYRSIFPAVLNKCLSKNPCRHGGVCEAVEDNYRCNCTGTNQYGPLCETGTNTAGYVVLKELQ